MFWQQCYSFALIAVQFHGKSEVSDGSYSANVANKAVARWREVFAPNRIGMPIGG